MLRPVTTSLLILILSSLVVACGTAPAEESAAEPAAEETTAEETGTLQFTANGEDFIRQGFESKDGWRIDFDHVYVNLTNITAYQADPPYNPDEGGPVEATTTVGLDGTYVVDLAEGDADAAPIMVGEVEVPAGQYNALSWEMVPAEEGDMAGYSLLMQGTAEKDGETVNFTIGVDRPYTNTCGEFVGDERKGIVEAGESADVELTFHFDHIFGDAELAADDDLNANAPGFEMFMVANEDGTLNTDLAALQASLTEDEHMMIVDILPSLGHVGEGHCYYGDDGHSHDHEDEHSHEDEDEDEG